LPAKLHQRIRLIPHGVREDFFYPKKPEKAVCGNRLIFVGALGFHKGADMLPAIFESVLAEIPQAHLTIVGDGPLRMVIEEEFMQRGISKNVAFAGKCEPYIVGKYMRNSDICLLPTRLEGFGLVIAEAMMCGVVPVVTYLSGITDEIVTDNYDGIIVQQVDNDSFVRPVIDLFGNIKKLCALKANAIKSAQARFKQSTMIDSYIDMFEEIDGRNNSIASQALWYPTAAFEYLKKKLI
jgi:glycosyltransferase involved in cell wall biosynthesis